MTIFTRREYIAHARERSVHGKGLLNALLVRLFHSPEGERRKRVNLPQRGNMWHACLPSLKEPRPDVRDEIHGSWTNRVRTVLIRNVSLVSRNIRRWRRSILSSLVYVLSNQAMRDARVRFLKHEPRRSLVYYTRKEICLSECIHRTAAGMQLKSAASGPVSGAQLGKDERLCGKRVLLFFERKYMARESCATSLDVGGYAISIHTQIDALYANGSRVRNKPFLPRIWKFHRGFEYF